MPMVGTRNAAIGNSKLRGEARRPTVQNSAATVNSKLQAVGEPGRPAGQEVIALAAGQRALRPRQQLAPVALEDLHGAVGPAVALALVAGEGLRRQPAAEDLVDVDGPVAVGHAAAGPSSASSQMHHSAQPPRLASASRRISVIVPCWMIASRSLRWTMPMWKKPGVLEVAASPGTGRRPSRGDPAGPARSRPRGSAK